MALLLFSRLCAVTPQNHIHRGVAGELDLFHTSPRCQQLLEDWKLFAPRLMDYRPYSRAEYRASITVARFEWRSVTKKKPNYFQLSAVRGPMQRIHTRSGTLGRIHAALQQVFSHLDPAKETSAGQGFGKGVAILAEAPLFAPVDNRRARAGTFLEHRLEPRKITAAQPGERIAERLVISCQRIHQRPKLIQRGARRQHIAHSDPQN